MSSVDPSSEPPEEPAGADLTPVDDPVADDVADDVVDDVVDEPEDERRYPSTVGGGFYLVALLATAVGLVIVWFGDWRFGIRWIAGGLVMAALVRLVLPRRDAGMLAVRHRMVDVLMLGLVGAALFFLASTIPNQPF